jgi:phosphonate transport system permease protein
VSAGAVQTTSRRKRPPFLAILLSVLIPGVGQIYMGERYRGVTILISELVTLLITFWYQVPIWFIVPAIIWLWNVWDVYNLINDSKKSMLIVFAAMLIMGYAIGWQVTQIDLSAFTRNLDRAASIVVPMFHPDFLSHQETLVSGWSPIQVPCGPNPPPALNTVNDITVQLSVDCTDPGGTFTMQASGLQPDSQTLLYWSTPIGDALPLGGGHAMPLYVNTDSQGRLSATIQVPPTALSAAPDPTLPLEHRVYVQQTQQLAGFTLSKNGGYLVQGIQETIFLALISTTFGALIAIPVGFLAARNLMGGNAITMGIYVVVRTILNIVRSIEPLIIAIVFVVIVGLGPFPGVIAISMHTVAALGKLFSEVIEGIDPGPLEAIRAVGGNWVQMVRYAVIPQIVPPIMSFTIYRWDINVRTSTIIGFVGGGGIGFYLYQWIIKGDYSAVGSAFIAIVIIVMILDFVSARIRARLV